MKRFLLFLALFAVIQISANGQALGDFQSFQTGNWSSTSSWSRWDGSNWINPAPSTPTSTDGVITVQSNHTITIPNATSEQVDQVTVQGQGVLTVNGTLIVLNGTGTDLTIQAADFITIFFDGKLNIESGGIVENRGQISTPTAGYQVKSGGEHLNNQNGGAIPSVTWDTGSTCTVRGITGTVPTGLGQSFYNFTWDNTGQSTTIFLAGALTTINGDFIVSSTNGNFLILDSGTTGTINVTGNVTVSNNSRLYITTTGTWTFAIGGNFTMQSTASGANGMILTATGTVNVNVTGNFSKSNSSEINMAASTGTGNLDVMGNFSFTAGTITESSSGQANIVFSGTSTQLYTGGGTYSNTINFTINNLATLDLGTGILSGTGTFNLNAGGTLRVGSTDVSGALQTGTTAGNIRVSGTRTFTANSSIVYNGGGAQVIGNGYPSSTAVNLEINNTSGVTNTAGSTSIIGDLTLTTGAFNIGTSSLLDVKSNLIVTSGTFGGSTTSDLIFSGSGSLGTVSFESGAQTLQNLTITRSGDLIIGSALTIESTLSLTGNLDFSGQTLTLNGTLSTSGGGLKSNSTANLSIGGSGVFGSIPFSGSGNQLNNLTFNRTGGGTYTWNSAVTINGNVNLNFGTLTHTSGLNMFTGSTFSRSLGATISAAPTATSTYNVSYASTLTTGPELPTAASGDLNNLTIAGDVTLDKAILIKGDLNLNSGTLDASTFNLEMKGLNFTANGGSFTVGAGSIVTFSGSTTLGGSSINNAQFGNLTIAGGSTLIGPAANINVSGTWNNLGIYTASSSTVTFNGAAQSIDAKGQSFNSVIFGGSGIKTLANNGLNVTGSLTINNSVTLDAGTATNNITLQGTWTNNGTYTPSGNTVTFNGTTQTIDNSGAFYNLVISQAGTKTLGSTLNVNNNLTINNSATLSTGVSSNAITVGGNWTNDATFTAGTTGTVTFDGTSTILGTSTTSFRNITIAGSVVGPAAMNVAGTWLYSSGSYNPNGGTVTFNGAAQSITSGAQSFDAVTISGSNTKTLQDAADINGMLMITSGTLAAGANNMTVAGNWTNNGGTFSGGTGTVTFDGTTTIGGSNVTSFNDIDIQGALTGHPTNMNLAGDWLFTSGSFTPGTGLVTFNGTGTQNLTSGPQSFNDLTAAGSGTVLLADALDVNNDLIITSTLSANTSNNITIGGDWNSSSGTFTQGTALVTFDGASAQNITSGSNSFNDLTLAGSGAKTLVDALDLDDALIISSELASGSNNINIGGDWTNNGTYTRGTETLTFDGSGVEQTIGGTSTTSFNDIDVSNTTGAQVGTTSTVELYGIFDFVGAALFDPDGGTAGVDGGGNFVIKSTGLSTTGRIADLSAGGSTASNFNGNIVVERYTGDATANRRIWRYLTPVSTATVADWQDDFTITGSFTGNDNATVGGAGLPSLYDYVEANATPTIDDGWRAYPPNNNGEAITAGVGYSAYIRGDRVDTQDVFEVRGTATVGAFAFTISDVNAGWNLLGNPYASPLDWNQLFDNGATSMNGSMFIKDNTGGGGFKGYNAASNIPISGGSQHISMGQAFWVQTSGGLSPALTAQESYKSTSASFLKLETPIDYLRITLTDAILRDETVIHFNANASAGFDVYDGNKQKNDYFNISTDYQNLTYQAFNTIPDMICSESFGINIDDVDPGNYSLEFSEFESFTESVEIVLFDKFKNTTTDVTSISTYSFEVTADVASFGKDRFEIIFDFSGFDMNVTTSGDESVCGTNDAIVLVDNTTGGISYSLKDAGGVLVGAIVPGNGAQISFIVASTDLVDGVNEFDLYGEKSSCGEVILPANISITKEIYTDKPTVESSGSCAGTSVMLTASGAPTGGAYQWYDADNIIIDGETESVFITPPLSVSTDYNVTVLNSVGCEGPAVQTRATISGNDVVANVTSVESCPGISVTLTATGAPDGGTYQWYDADNNKIDGETDPVYVTAALSVSTDYFVTVLNGSGCEGAPVQTTAKISSTALTVEARSSFNCGSGSVTLTASGSPEGLYRWFNADGSVINGATSSEYLTGDLSTSTLFMVQSQSALGCTSATIEIEAEIRPLADQPVIVRDGNLLVVSNGPYNSYQWLRNGEVIEGENGSSLLVEADGHEYTVEAGNNGCTEISDPLVVTGIEPDAIKVIDVYPNPVSETIHVQFDQTTADVLNVFILDMNGKITYKSEIKRSVSGFNFDLNVNDYRNGIYFVKMSDGEKVYTGKFVKE